MKHLDQCATGVYIFGILNLACGYLLGWIHRSAFKEGTGTRGSLQSGSE
jgi:hypothetical protein